MQLSDYLAVQRIRRGEFARLISVSPGWITCLCDGTGWPSREVAERIAKATKGAVTPNDFVKLSDLQSAG